MRKLFFLVLILGCLCSASWAQTSDSIRSYTKDNPLVYEDVWDLWPYSFLNENGKPDGFNVDLIRLLMSELNIPYVIKLKPSAEAFRDLRDGKSDLMLGLAVGFHDEFGHYSKNAVTLFTQSLVRPKSKPLSIKRFHDLSNHQVIVNDSSLAHHLMMEYGWGANAIPVEDMREAIQQVSAQEEGQIVWNTLSLKWLMRRYHTDNLELTPVNMQHGQYKFMSNDTHLLNMLDKTYARLYAEDKIIPLQDKWFYPEREDRTVEPWVWYAIVGSALFILFFSIYVFTYRIHAGKLTSQNEKRNKRLALILETSHVHMWTYNIKEQQFAWRNNNGQIAYTYSMEEFSQRYSADDFIKLQDGLRQLATQGIDQEKDIVLELKARDIEDGDTEKRDYYVVLSVLSRDKDGMPSVILGTKKDVTKEHKQKRLFNEKTLRYHSIMGISLSGITISEKNGKLNVDREQSTLSVSNELYKESERHLTTKMQIHDNLIKSIELILREPDIRLVTYSPTEHLLTIHRNLKEVQHALTQTRCMTLVDDRSKKTAMHMLNKMDDRENIDVYAHIHTTLRTKERRKLCLDFNLMPILDNNDEVTLYLGLCRDTSEQCEMTMEMERQTAKVQEVENTKNSFVKNMVQDIKKPMETVIRLVDQLGEQHSAEVMDNLYEGILDNSDYLLHFIDNILYLSRLEAHMVEINKQPCNFANIFDSLCEKGWHKYRNANTRYLVDSPYSELTVDIDQENLGHAVEQLTANAAQHTKSGIVRARYEYIGRRLIISIDDTGEGIPPQELERLQSNENAPTNNTKGLGLAICKELVAQMGGTIDLHSEEGSGTTVYMTIPCLALTSKRKRIEY